jgi:uncharacterized phage protein gp47/JayE
MPNVISASGMQIQTIAEIIDSILLGTPTYSGMFQIYGVTINVEPNSPDGQMVNIVAQAKLDVLEAIQQVYNSFDPDQAVGVQLDQRCAINGVIRNAGSYTLQQVAITTNTSVTLVGLDAAPAAPFVVQDGAGNRYAPLTTQVIGGAGTTTILFQALVIGNVESSPNSITTISTVQAGVTACNNPSGPTSIGLIEETDYSLRIRRQNSTAIAAQGFYQSLVGNLLNTEGVLQALVLENTTATTDANGIPSHSIWVIVLGGANDAIADVIYRVRNAGCGMYGSVTVSILQVDGTTFDVKFSRPVDEMLYISFDIAAITGSIDETYLRNQLLAQLSYGINQTADTTSIVSLIHSIMPNGSVTNEGVSPDDMVYTATLAPSTVDKQFIISAATIKINGSVG